MSWTDYFPVFTDEMLAEYTCLEQAFSRPQKCRPEVPEEHLQLRAIPEYNANREAQQNHIVSLSLSVDDLAKGIGIQILETDTAQALKKKLLQLKIPEIQSDVWEAWVTPLIREVPRLTKEFPNCKFRIYLAQNLKALSPILTGANCEVYLVTEDCGLVHKYPNLWRHLALAEENTFVTVAANSESDRLEQLIERTHQTYSAGMGCWRHVRAASNSEEYYQPIDSTIGYGAAVIPDDIQALANAFINAVSTTSTRNKILDDHLSLKPLIEQWDDSHLEALFLMMCLYPRLLEKGTLTLVAPWCHTIHLALDIEYATWWNSRSELHILS